MLPIAPPPEPLPQIRAVAPRRGNTVAIDGERVESTWEWRGNNSKQPDQLWLPLDLLEARLGFRRQARPGGDALEWFGRTVALRRLDSRTLGDEVGFDVGGWLTSVGVDTKRKGGTLMLRLPSPALQGLRRGKGATAKRLVLDLNGPTFAQRIGTDLAFALQTTSRQRNILSQLGLHPLQEPCQENSFPPPEDVPWERQCATRQGEWRAACQETTGARTPSMRAPCLSIA